MVGCGVEGCSVCASLRRRGLVVSPEVAVAVRDYWVPKVTVGGYNDLLKELEERYEAQKRLNAQKPAAAPAAPAPGPFVVGPFGTPWPAAENAADDLTTWIGKTFGVDATKPDISEADTLEIKLPVCTANPSCGEDDVICPQCKAGNCPGVKCWRGCNG